MALPTTGAISTDQIMGPDGLNIGVQSMEWSALWALAVPGSIPKNKANAGGPYVLPNDWYGYVHGNPGPFGGTLTINVPGYGNNIAPSSPGSNMISGYTMNSGITINNTHPTETVKFSDGANAPIYPVIVASGAAKLMQYASNPVCHFNTAPQDGELIPPGSYATWLSFGKTSGSGVVILSIEVYMNTGVKTNFYWSFNI